MTRMFKIILKPLLLLAALPVISHARNAEPQRWFQADMVVFVNLNSMNGAEQWPKISPHTIPANAIKLRSPDAPNSAPGINDLLRLHKQDLQKALPDLQREAFVSLPGEAHVLLKEGNTIDATNGYKVISRNAWIMPLQDDSRSKPIRIRAYNNTGRPSLLEGSVSISSSRFLHVDVNLWYSELSREALSDQLRSVTTDAGRENLQTANSEKESGKAKPEIRRDLQLVMDPSGTPMKITRNFQLRESRRIRNTQQVQYLDSPVLGVLIKLTPYDLPEIPLLPEIESVKQPEPVLGLLPGLNLEG
ncbi:peptidoglycan binding protein CsiV [Endozoicomonas euniceicola]|uniref:Peptidoglycan binding protein CsiV n=1 Tax=Endozoicomonas euniceicola TaxID=1234143 RepID=A0ABY6GUR1_9GAMM|nr:peptidoglycan binding protein CsiV [Endozoicomonas euniceicola]UYM15796.1 peptidoglycan binding protein CsiV [Endozoicomonas euniceicola]